MVINKNKNYFNIKKKKSDASGKIGQYIKLTNLFGVKLIGFWGCDSVVNLKKSITWKKALKEAEWLKFVNASKLSPNCYGVYPVKFKGRFFAGIFMDHINGSSLNSITKNGIFQQGSKIYVSKNGIINLKNNKIPIIKFLKNKLTKIGINHFDIHGENVLVDKNNKIWLIDFSSDYISKKNKRE